MTNKELVSELLSKMEDPPVLEKPAKEVRGGDFRIGQRVRFSKRGRRAFERSIAHDSIGVVKRIEDLSRFIPLDDPYGTRSFSLTVKFEGKSGLVEGNGAFFEKAK